MSSRMINLEWQCWTDAYYPQLECLEIVGITSPVSVNELKSTIFDKICDYAKEDDIEASHRLYSSKKTVVKFEKKKYTNKSYELKNNLKGLNLVNLILLKAHLFLLAKAYVSITKR